MSLLESNQRPGYKEVKNHIHNTLGLTTEMIRDMIKEAVQEEASRLISSSYVENLVDVKISRVMSQAMGMRTHGQIENIRQRVAVQVASAASKILLDQLTIRVGVKEVE